MSPHTSLAASDRLRAYVDVGAIAGNLKQMRQRLGAAPRIWATAKADAYGHGLIRVLDGLGDADGITVQTLTEAHRCRQGGWRGPILVHTGLLSRSEIQGLTLSGIHLLISTPEQLDWLAIERPASPPVLWLRFQGDTNLSGFDEGCYRAAHTRATALTAQGHASGVGHVTHFACAEESEGIRNTLKRYGSVIAGLPGPVSTCNSAAILRHGSYAATTDWVRPGISLYGCSPLHGTTGAALGLRAAMTLTARLLSMQRLPAGASIGYGRAFVTREAMTVGHVACGYGDGYPRHASTGTPVLAAGQRCRLVGRPTMDGLVIDLSSVHGASPGMPVVLWGEDLPVEQVAESMGTIPAELLTGLTPRVPVTTLR